MKIHFRFCLLTVVILLAGAICAGQSAATNIEKTYDSDKDRTIVRLLPVQISGGEGKYKSLKLSPSFSFAGKTLQTTPSIIDFELQTVVKGRLRTDLYVVFVVDGEKVFLGSNRWAIKRPVPGRLWVGERLVFRMPYETFVRVTKAKSFALSFDGVEFPVSETHLQLLREFLKQMQPES
jgi:hypothetical protein